MGDSPFQAFAERHDLDYAERVLPGGGVGRKGVSEVAGGSLPGGLAGVVARYEQEVKAKVLEDSSSPQLRRVTTSSGQTTTSKYFRDSCMLMTRVPESAAFLPYVTCRDSTVRGVTDRLIGPGGLIPLVDHVEFESTELNRRYRIGTFKGQTSGNRLRQLFAPTLIDWMAHAAPEGLYFELFGGVLMLTVTGRVTEESQIDHACELAGHLAERIRSESIEAVADDGTPEYSVPPEQIEQERKRADTLAAATFGEPPDDFATAFATIEPVVKGQSKGFLRKVFKGINKDEARDLAIEALVRAYGERHGLEWQRATEFIGRHSGSPMLIPPKHALRGPLPSLGITGDLFTFGGAAQGDAQSPSYTPGATLPFADTTAVLQIVPATERQEGSRTIGGFQVVATGGAQRTSKASKRDAEVSASMGEELGGGFTVIAHNCGPGVTITPAMREWLLAEDRAGVAAMTAAGGTLTVFSAPKPAAQWSFATFDELCTSLAPLR